MPAICLDLPAHCRRDACATRLPGALVAQASRVHGVGGRFLDTQSSKLLGSGIDRCATIRA